jgi:hypothetical protein
VSKVNSKTARSLLSLGTTPATLAPAPKAKRLLPLGSLDLPASGGGSLFPVAAAPASSLQIKDDDGQINVVTLLIQRDQETKAKEQAARETKAELKAAQQERERVQRSYDRYVVSSNVGSTVLRMKDSRQAASRKAGAREDELWFERELMSRRDNEASSDRAREREREANQRAELQLERDQRLVNEARQQDAERDQREREQRQREQRDRDRDR